MSDYYELKRKIISKAALEKIPVVGEFELSPACNFSCKMCYLAGKKDQGLKKAEWESIFNGAVNAGLLYGLLTGGEPFLCKDFPDFYNYLYDHGVRITIFTNGSLWPDYALSLFMKKPPETIAITLYGGCEETYEEVTKTKGSFAKVKRTIDNITDAGLPLALRTIPLPEVYHDLDNIIALAKGHNFVLGYTLYIAPDEHGHTPERLTAEQLADFEKRICDAFPEAYRKSGKNKSDCAALKSGCYIDNQGFMRPCALLDMPKERLEPGRYLETFRRLSTLWEEMSLCNECITCEYVDGCINCPASRCHEGDIKKCHEYLQNIARKRMHHEG
ncbi:MAG TPA: radical SAM protein [Candidatus Izemoplasmatales bacterium]|nr:radical SAM protein [Candidatus Izemoplasmatales bacterium]